MDTKLSSNHSKIIKILPSGFASSLEGEQKWPVKVVVIKQQEIKEPLVDHYCQIIMDF